MASFYALPLLLPLLLFFSSSIVLNLPFSLSAYPTFDYSGLKGRRTPNGCIGRRCPASQSTPAKDGEGKGGSGRHAPPAVEPKLAYNRSTENWATTKEIKAKTLGIIGVGIGVPLLLVVSLVLSHYFCSCAGKRSTLAITRKTKSGRREKKLEAILERFVSLAPTRYTYLDVVKMTSSFNHKLGEGGNGGVFKGKLGDGRPVAVKVLKSAKGSGKEFFNEVISIGCTYHVNIVSLLGFCLEGSRRVLIYEFMPNGSLEKFIHNHNKKVQMASSVFDWGKLLDIAIGIARGLEYLHHGCNIGILHFDIKPHNILLDEDCTPKISDFGLAKMCQSAEGIISMLGARGTAGYIAPEVFSRSYGGVSNKSDVYSYGMVVLEMAGGRRNVEARVENTSELYFPYWVCKHLELSDGLKSFRVGREGEEEIARRMALVGLWCIQTRPTDRPSMSRVVDMLEGRISDLKMPPMPVLSSPSRSLKQSLPHQSSEIVSELTL